MSNELRFERPIRVAEGVFWIGVYDSETELHCNPYLVKGEKGVAIIDSGSRPDFAGVMMKVLQTGVHPNDITALIYQHYDPDLCGSLPNYLDLCTNPELRIYSKHANNVFIRHYVEKSFHGRFADIRDQETLDLGDRKLRFIGTPYAHAPGSFATLDERTGTLFTRDLFGSYRYDWDLFLELDEKCFTCSDFKCCPNDKAEAGCPFPDMISFHKGIMPSTRALRLAINRVRSVEAAILAPQHGSILRSLRVISHVMSVLEHLEGVGIYGISDEG